MVLDNSNAAAPVVDKMSYARKRRSFARLSAGHNLANTTEQNFERAYLDDTHFDQNPATTTSPIETPNLLQKQAAAAAAKPAAFSRFLAFVPKLFFAVFVVILGVFLAGGYSG